VLSEVMLQFRLSQANEGREFRFSRDISEVIEGEKTPIPENLVTPVMKTKLRHPSLALIME
jgi:hypothetical protein